MLIDAKDQFMERMAHTYIQAQKSKGNFDADIRFVNLDKTERVTLNLIVTKLKLGAANERRR